MECCNGKFACRHGGTLRCLRALLKVKLVHHENTKYDGYRLTYLGYDYLAIKTLVNKGAITGIGRQIGVGKEADVFEVCSSNLSFISAHFMKVPEHRQWTGSLEEAGNSIPSYFLFLISLSEQDFEGCGFGDLATHISKGHPFLLPLRDQAEMQETSSCSGGLTPSKRLPLQLYG